MKKINIVFLIFCFIGITSCEKEVLIKINPKAEEGTLKFHLNKLTYADWTYVLEDANASFDMDSLTCVQPDYGFTAAVNYSTQVGFDSLFVAGTYQTLATTVNGEKVGINTKEMDKAIIALYGGKLPDPVVKKQVFIRLMAYINNATHSALTDSLIVKPLYSNAIELNIMPYVLPLFPYTEITPKLWYIIGLGDGNWTNATSAIGTSLIPLSIESGKKYNLNGDGEFTYTGYFSASKSFKLMGPGLKWDANVWGMTGTTYIHGGGDNITVPSDGYYTITLNSIENTLTIVPAIITPTSYNAIGLIGAFNGWGGDVALTATAGTNNHIWYTTYTLTADSQLKLRANGAWDVNWGTPSPNDGDPLYSAMGIGYQSSSSKNLIEPAGTYIVVFNDIDSVYYFIKQ